MVQKFRRIIGFVAVLLPGAVTFSTAGDRAPAELFRQMVELVPIVFADMDSTQPGVAYSRAPNLHTQGPSYLLAFLYKTDRPDNPYYGDKRLFDTAVAMCNHIVATNQDGLEWPMYDVCQVYDLLKAELPETTLAVYRAGQVFGRPDWMDQGRFLMRRLLEIQTPLGYWEEGPHHGPSMKYNQLMLDPILLYADYSGDEQALAVGKKLADFMIRYSLPDGSFSGALDGRQSYFLSYFGTTVYGLDRWPAGKTLNRLLIATRKRYRSFSPKSKYYSLSDWYAYFGIFCLVDAYRSIVPEAPEEPLPQSRNGYVVEDHSCGFDACLVREHDWCVVLSGIFSDIPKVSRSIYRLERQSRIDIWHEKTGLVIGGGHNMTGARLPLANAALLTGFGGDMDFGEMVGDDFSLFRSLYYPRAVKTSVVSGVPRLHLVFGQGTVDFAVRPVSGERLDIEYCYDVYRLQKMYIQLPVVVFAGGELRVDGREFSGRDKVPVKRSLTVENPFMGSRVKITVPGGSEARLRWPISPMRWYIPLKVRQRYEPVYRIALLSLKIDRPHGKGKGTFRLEIQ